MVDMSLVTQSAILSLLVSSSWSACPFQNPFSFLDPPAVVSVVDKDGKVAADRVRVTWGKVDNFKCVDFFQIEYYEQHDPVGTVQMSGKVNKNRKSLDIDIKPCSDYRFKVIASEDWKGMREDFKTASDIMEFKLEFTPKLKRPPVVKERRIRLKAPKVALGSGANPRRKRSPLFEEIGRTPSPPRPPPVKIPYNIWVSWRLSDVDWPMCVDRVEFQYVNLANNVVKFNKTFSEPFAKLMEFDLDDKLIPCNDEFDYVTKVYGKNGNHSISYWTPPSCKKTTPAPTTTTTAAPTTTTMGDEEKAKALEDNILLKQELKDLKRAYHSIGETMYEVVKDNVYHDFEAYLARKKVFEGGDLGRIQQLAKYSSDPFYALNYYYDGKLTTSRY